MKRASSLVALAALAAACAPEPQPPTIALGGTASPPPVVAIAAPAAAPEPPHRGQWKGPIDRAPPDDVGPPGAPVALPVAAPGLKPDMVRDPRLGARLPRPFALLVAEIQALESLFKVVPPASPDRPKLILRLAEGYAELEAAAAREPPHARSVTPARHEAIARYDRLLQEYPSWCGRPNASDPSKGAGCGDEALYYLGLELERDGDVMGARKAYFRVVQSWPLSRFIPGAYLAFGEMFLAESDQDPSKLPLAQQSYLQVLKYPPPDNVVYGYAQLQLGRVHLSKGDRAQAARAFKAAIQWANTHPTALGGGPVMTAAQEALQKLGVP